MDILIKRIKQWRYDHYVTQQQLADKIGCPRNTLHCWETGRRVPGCEAIIALCRAMNVSADWLLGLTDTQIIGQALASPRAETASETDVSKAVAASSSKSMADCMDSIADSIAE